MHRESKDRKKITYLENKITCCLLHANNAAVASLCLCKVLPSTARNKPKQNIVSVMKPNYNL